MLYSEFGPHKQKVSKICLGTMTWGEQNTESEAHDQLDFAFERGVNFIDTAEMYPIPPKDKTYSLTESYIGNWKGLHQNREKIYLASKVVGPMPNATYIRNGETRLDKKNIMQALEDSLRRLNTDYLDLYQLHWPDRKTNFFGRRGYQHKDEAPMTHPEETLEVLAEIYESGKVRSFGLSNETPWGAMTFLKLSEQKNYPRMLTIQNPYSLLNRTFEVGLAEIGVRENLQLLAYSPLGFGVLTGKYLENQHPEGSRLSLFKGYTRYSNINATLATEKYVQLAKQHGLDPAQMALQFVTTREFTGATIIGATDLDQLEANINSVDVHLSEEVLAGIEAIHTQYPNPSP